MARAKVTHSDDAVQITFNGDKRHPERQWSSSLVDMLRFPVVQMEPTGHTSMVDAANVADSRIQFQDAIEYQIRCVQEIPNGNLINHIAVRIANAVPHFDPNA